MNKTRERWVANGLCLRCGGRRDDPDRKTCSLCLQKHRERYNANHKKGLCYCGRILHETDKTHCKVCLERKQKKNKALTAKGFCYCGSPSDNGSVSCISCKEKRKQSFRERVAHNLCGACGRRPIEKRNRCSHCRNVSAKRRFQIFLEVIDAYGGAKCVCCGENNIKFLTIDHVDGGGNEHRRQIGSPNIYGWLRRNNYPKGFQVLCYNCNCGRARNGGICPHKESKK